MLFAIVLIEEEAAVLLFRDGVTFDTEFHFGGIFAAGSAENLAVGQNQRAALIMQFGIEAGRHLFHQEQWTGADFAVRLDREAVLGQHGAFGRRAGVFEQAVIGAPGIGVIVDETAAMGVRDVGHGGVIGPRLIGRHPLVSGFGVTGFQTALDAGIGGIRLGGGKLDLVRCAARTARIAGAARITGIGRRARVVQIARCGARVTRVASAALVARIRGCAQIARTVHARHHAVRRRAARGGEGRRVRLTP